MPSRHARGPRRLKRRVAHTLLAAAVLALGPAVAWAAPSDVYYERTLMSAANQRCGLFTPDLAAALESARAQARGAALRSGVSGASLEGIGQSARRRAGEAACGSKDLVAAAARVRTAFDGYAHLLRMTFRGDVADWRADRTQAQRAVTWRLAQSSRFGPDSLVFGLAGQGGASALVAAASFADGAQPYAARLVLRDVRRAADPCPGQAGHGLAARMPLRSATTGFLAEVRANADTGLLPKGVTGGLAFRFPSAAIDALAGLDPREAVAVEFLFNGSSGESVRTAYVEVGDFAAGRAFLLAAQR